MKRILMQMAGILIIIILLLYMFNHLEKIKDNAVALAVGAFFTGSLLFWLIKSAFWDYPKQKWKKKNAERSD